MGNQQQTAEQEDNSAIAIAILDALTPTATRGDTDQKVGLFLNSPDRGLYPSLGTLFSKMRSRNINNNFAVKIGNRGGAFN
jgi:hypothetical protein